MTRVTPKSAQNYVANLQKKLETIADGRTTVKASEIKGDPMLADLAKSVFSGCGTMKDVSVAKMKDALKTIGATMSGIDKDKDGSVDYAETANLSPLALRMLDMAAEGGASVRKPKPTPNNDPAAAPKPKPPVRTGC